MELIGRGLMESRSLSFEMKEICIGDHRLCTGTDLFDPQTETILVHSMSKWETICTDANEPTDDLCWRRIRAEEKLSKQNFSRFSFSFFVAVFVLTQVTLVSQPLSYLFLFSWCWCKYNQTHISPHQRPTDGDECFTMENNHFKSFKRAKPGTSCLRPDHWELFVMMIWKSFSYSWFFPLDTHLWESRESLQQQCRKLEQDVNHLRMANAGLERASLNRLVRWWNQKSPSVHVFF